MAGKTYLDCKSYEEVFGDLNFTIAGMTSLKTTCMEITDTETKLPVSAFANRKSMTIYVLSGGTMYLGNTGVTADNAIGNTAGVPVPVGSSWNVDFAGSADIYGVAASGQTLLIKLIEYA